MFIQRTTNNACFLVEKLCFLAKVVAGSDFHRGIFPANSHLGRAGKTANAASIITSHSICHIRVGIRKRSPGLRRTRGACTRSNFRDAISRARVRSSHSYSSRSKLIARIYVPELTFDDGPYDLPRSNEFTKRSNRVGIVCHKVVYSEYDTRVKKMMDYRTFLIKLSIVQLIKF